ncbi:MAG: fibronectin type III domain-containing protein [Verrucomicrobiae bacterium]|nr:fibronectin type III domain-containing protein [Verrucomicrobiae bacterium]
MASGGRTEIASLSEAVSLIFTWEDYLFVVTAQGWYYSFNRISAVPVTAGFLEKLHEGFAVADGQLYVNSTSSTPRRFTLRSDGTVSADRSGIEGNPLADVLFFTEGHQAFSNQGHVYNLGDLKEAGTLGKAVFGATSFVGGTVILEGRRLSFLSSGLQELSTIPLPDFRTQLAAYGNRVFAFGLGGVDSTELPIDAYLAADMLPNPLPPEEDPQRLSFEPSFVVQRADGNILLGDNLHRRLHEWSPVEQRYVRSVPLNSSPVNASYDPVNDTLYLSDFDPGVRRIMLSDPAPSEHVWLETSGAPASLHAASGYVVIGVGKDDPGDEFSHRFDTFSAMGQKIDSKVLGRDDTLLWDPSHRRFFHVPSFASFGLGWIPIGADGRFGTAVGPPDANAFSLGAGGLFADPQGARLLHADGMLGKVFDSVTAIRRLERPDSGDRALVGAVWSEGITTVLRKQPVASDDRTRLESWASDGFQLNGIRDISGTGLGLFAIQDRRMLAVVQRHGRPRFVQLNPSLAIEYLSPSVPSPPGDLDVTSRGTGSIGLQWSDASDDEERFVLEFRETGVETAWSVAATTGVGATSATVAGLTSGTLYEFRVSAGNRIARSSHAPITVATLADERYPGGAPYHLEIARISGTWAELRWRDNARNESGFRLEWSTVPDFSDGSVQSAAVGPNRTSLRIDGLSPSRTYWFRIVAFNAFQEDEFSPPVTGTTARSDLRSPPPDAGSQLAVVADVFSPQAVLTWDTAPASHDGFIVRRLVYARNGGFVANPLWEVLARLDYTTGYFADPQVEFGTVYNYTVHSFNPFGETLVGEVSAIFPGLGYFTSGLIAEGGGIVYFYTGYPERIERYDVAAAKWLTPAFLDFEVSALEAGKDGVVVRELFSGRLWHFNEAQEGWKLVAANSLDRFFMLDKWLHIDLQGSIRRIDLETGGSQSQANVTFPPYNLLEVPGTNRLYYSTGGDLSYLQFDSVGRYVGAVSNPSANSLPGWGYVSVSPDGSKLVSVEGAVIDRESGKILTSLGGTPTGAKLLGDGRSVVLKDQQLLQLLDPVGLEIGRIAVGPEARFLSSSGDEFVVFSANAATEHGMGVDRFRLHDFRPMEKSLSTEIGGLPKLVASNSYQLFSDGTDVIYFLSEGERAIFRWSSTAEQFLPPIPLSDAPIEALYHRSHQQIYLNYRNSSVSAIDPETVRERPFHAPYTQVQGMMEADEKLLINHDNFNPEWIEKDGSSKIAGRDMTTGGTRASVWDGSRRRLYYLHGSTLVSTPIAIDGTPGESQNSLLSNGYNTLNANPELSLLINGAKVFNASDLSLANTLEGFSDGISTVWSGSLIYGAAWGESDVRIFDGSTYRQKSSIPVGGHIWYFVPMDDGAAVVTQVDDRARFFRIRDGAILTSSSLLPKVPTGLTATPTGTDSIDLRWRDQSDNESGHVIEVRLASAPRDPWVRVAVAAGEETFRLHGLARDTVYAFRILAVNEAGESTRSASVSSSTLREFPAATQIFSIESVQMGADGAVTLAFPAESGAEYIIEYSADTVTWNTSPARAAIAEDWGTWIDMGPPATSILPRNETVRFYRVRQIGL